MTVFHKSLKTSHDFHCSGEVLACLLNRCRGSRYKNGRASWIEETVIVLGVFCSLIHGWNLWPFQPRLFMLGESWGEQIYNWNKRDQEPSPRGKPTVALLFLITSLFSDEYVKFRFALEDIRASHIFLHSMFVGLCLYRNFESSRYLCIPMFRRRRRSSWTYCSIQ